MKKQILKLLRPIRFKVYIEAIVNTWANFFLVASIVTLVLSVYAHLIVFPFAGNYMLTSFFFITLLGLLVGLFRGYPSTNKILLVTDQLGLKERLTTSWQLLGDQSSEAYLQRNETIQFIKNKKFANKYKMKFNTKKIFIAFLVLIVASGLFFIQSQAKEVAEEEEAFKNKLVEKKEELLKEKDELLEAYEIPEEKKKELEEMLKPLLEKFQEAKTEEEALKELSIIKDEIKKLDLGKELEALKALEEVAKNLAAKQKDKSNGEEEVKQEDLEKLLETLESLKDKLENEETKEQVNEQLEQLAEALKNADDSEASNELVESSLENLAELLEALADTDPNSQLANELQNTINDMANSISSNESITDLAFNNNTTSSSQSSSESTSSSTASESSDQGSSEGSGEESGEGSGEESGEGSGEESGQGSGEESGQGTGEESGQGSGQESGQGRGFGSTEEYLFDPTHLGGSSDPTFVKGNRLESGDVDSNQVEDQPLDIGGMVNYQELYIDYFNQARQTMDNLDVPVVMKDIILEYFSDIE